MTGAFEEKNKFLILVVDDDRGARLLLRQAMEREGYAVAEAGDGLQALGLFADLRPDIVLMDSMMPELDGFTACARLRELPGGEQTPVLMITGLTDEKSVNLAFEAGAHDLITKPVNWGVLCQRVRRLLRARQAEVMLNRSEANTKSIISHSLDGIITIDGSGLIKSFNPAAEMIFGYSAADIVRHDVRMILPGAYRQRDIHSEEGRPGGESRLIGVKREIDGRRRDGSLFPAEITISGYTSGERLITVRDVTDRKLAEERLRMAAKVFESTTEGIVVIDKKGIVQSVNNAFSDITGYSAGEVVGRYPPLIESGLHDAGFFSSIAESLQGSGNWQGEIRVRRKKGDIYTAWLSISVIKDDSGRTTHYAVVFSDITERIRLAEEKQRLIEQTARAQKLASLGTISAGIAHEINQPLNSIKVIVDGMLYWQKKGRPPEPEKIIENLQKISARASRIDEIIKHMRSFVSVGNPSKMDFCSLNNTVSGALGMVGHQLSSHGITIRKDLEKNLPPVVGNANRLEEVAVNLLVNAMQALDSVGRQDKLIVCRTGTEGSSVFLEVSDNATGISGDILEKIFDPFFSTKKAGEGMGLGLSIVQSVVSGLNGEITAANNGDGGATFRVTLPAAGGGCENDSNRGVPGEHTTCR